MQYHSNNIIEYNPFSLDPATQVLTTGLPSVDGSNAFGKGMKTARVLHATNIQQVSFT